MLLHIFYGDAICVVGNMRFGNSVRAANIAWWNSLGMVFLITGLILVFLSYSTEQIAPVIPYQTIGSEFSYLSAEAFTVGAIGAIIGVVLMVVSKFRLSALSIDDARYDDWEKRMDSRAKRGYSKTDSADEDESEDEEEPEKPSRGRKSKSDED